MLLLSKKFDNLITDCLNTSSKPFYEQVFVLFKYPKLRVTHAKKFTVGTWITNFHLSGIQMVVQYSD